MFHTKGRSGLQRKRITVTTNQKDNPKVFFNLTGTVVSEVTVSPRVVSFGQLEKGKKGTKKITVTIRDPEKVSLTSVAVDVDAFKVRLVSDRPGEKTYQVEFSGDKVDRYSGKLTLALKGARRESYTVPLRAEVVGDLRYSQSLYFIKRNGQFAPRDLTISSRSKKKVHIKQVVDKDGLLDFRILENDGPAAKIRVAVRDVEASYTRPRRGTFFVHTSSADQPRLKVVYTVAERTRRPPVPSPKDLQLNLKNLQKGKSKVSVPPSTAPHPPATASEPSKPAH